MYWNGSEADPSGGKPQPCWPVPLRGAGHLAPGSRRSRLPRFAKRLAAGNPLREPACYAVEPVPIHVFAPLNNVPRRHRMAAPIPPGAASTSDPGARRPHRPLSKCVCAGARQYSRFLVPIHYSRFWLMSIFSTISLYLSPYIVRRYWYHKTARLDGPHRRPPTVRVDIDEAAPVGMRPPEPHRNRPRAGGRVGVGAPGRLTGPEAARKVAPRLPRAREARRRRVRVPA